MFTRALSLLLLRGLFFAFAVIGVIELWEGRMFIGTFPFTMQFTLDIVFVALFFMFSWRAPKFFPIRVPLLYAGVLMWWLFILITNALNVALFIQQFGLQGAASHLGISPEWFLIRGFLLFALVPTIVFGILWWLIRRVDKMPAPKP